MQNDSIQVYRSSSSYLLASEIIIIMFCPVNQTKTYSSNIPDTDAKYILSIESSNFLSKSSDVSFTCKPSVRAREKLATTFSFLANILLAVILSYPPLNANTRNTLR